MVISPIISPVINPIIRPVIGQGGVETPLPPALADLRLWLDAMDLATISVTGTAVTQWNDKSGNNFNVTQATGSLRPQYNSTLKSIDFLGSGIKLARAAALLPAASSHTILFAASRIDNTGAEFNDTVIEQGDDSGNWGIRLKIPPLGGYRLGYKIVTNLGNTNGPIVFEYTTGVNRIGLFEWNQATNTLTAFINAVQRYTESRTGNILGNLNLVQIGSRTSVATSVRLHEILVYNKVLSTDEKAEGNAYLADKWGITL
jgi:hypothetical protein